MKQAVSCGHALTAKAAMTMLNKGGNAFDGIVAAVFASTVVEPMLTSLAGAGVGLLSSGDEVKAIDFLADFPRKGHNPPVKAIRKVVSFGDETQVFYLGYGSLGVPGSLEGLLHMHKNYCTMELRDLLAPSIKYAKGHKVSQYQFDVFKILEAYCKYTPKAREVFAPKGRLLEKGDTIRNLKLAHFLEMLAEDEKAAKKFYLDSVAEELAAHKSTLSMDDIRHYKVKERKPIEISYRGHDLYLTPPPSAGGILIAYGLKSMEALDIGKLKHNSPEHVKILVDAMKLCDSKRTKDFFNHLLYKKNFWKQFLKKPERLGGTTHISVIDREGNAAGITTSNGQGAGVMAGDTGIMFNNFAAEPDLMQYKALYKSGERITTMMSPTMITKNGKFKAILGSGGSNRIRSAIMQVISNLIDFKMPPKKAANASRVHYEYKVLQLEQGISRKTTNEMKRHYKTNAWTQKNMFFGGVHVATPDGGGGDLRRSGIVLTG